jgi:hypothetical protein
MIQKKTKVCTKCNKRKKVSEFDPQSTPKEQYLRPHCRSCVNEYQRHHRKVNPRYFRDAELRSHYGISLIEWEELFAKQGKCCAICGVKKPNVKKQWFTDHDHEENFIRGILCGLCNTMLGNARESIRILRLAIKYLKKFKPTETKPNDHN